MSMSKRCQKGKKYLKKININKNIYNYIFRNVQHSKIYVIFTIYLINILAIDMP